jgi:uncharacterized membrane protein YhaH (DUF805 family)
LFFSFRGRISRRQYATVILAGYIGSIAVFALTWPSLRAMGDFGVFTGIAILVVAFWILFAAMAKRFHDMNKPGLHSVLLFAPFRGTFWPIALLFYRGDATENEFGPPPN